MILIEGPHRRLSPLTGEWTLVSPHRDLRPWQGRVENLPIEKLAEYDPQCYLCPGNTRASGARNPQYNGTLVFDNDFPALLPSPDRGLSSSDKYPLLQAEAESGICRVVCFSPRHDLTLPEMSTAQAGEVVRIWMSQTRELGNLEAIRYVQIFENKGEVMGCSNPHPHNQIWATAGIPNEPAKELHCQRAYFQEHRRPLLHDYLEAEQQLGQRLLFANDHFTAMVPFWAVWPFELLVIAHRQVARISELSDVEAASLADILLRISTRYDNLFETSFPYSMGFHQAPTDGQPHPEWVLHAHYYPPLLRSATIRKFMVGFEMLAMPQRDLTAETAAERLRRLNDVHYRRIHQP
jgi:UDPglucose--hexose-1-phosphate uridylyltransferase